MLEAANQSMQKRGQLVYLSDMQFPAIQSAASDPGVGVIEA
jgi:hypothetical protein